MPRARPTALAAFGLAALLAAGFAFAQSVAQQRLEEALARLRSVLPPGVTLSYASATTDAVSGRVTLASVALANGDKRVDADSVVLDGLLAGGTGFAAAELRGISISEGQQSFGRIARIAAEGLSLPPSGVAFDPLAILADRAEITGIAIDAPGGGFGAARIALEGFGGDRPGALALEAVKLTMPGTPEMDRMTLRRAEATGFRFVDAIRAIQTGVRPATPLGRSTIEVVALAGSNPQGEVFRLAGLSGEADDVPGRPGLKATRLALTGFEMPARPELAWLTRMGYQRLAFDLGFDGDIAPDAGDYDIRSIRLAMPEAGVLELAASLTGLPVPRDGASADPAVLANARLVSFGVTYVDASLFGRALRMQAQQQRTTEQALRGQLGQMVAVVFSPTGGKGGQPDPIGEALLRFIRQPGTLEIRGQPPVPVAFTDVTPTGPDGAAGVIRTLGITAAAR